MKRIFQNLIDDTLKREKDGERRFSKTALTMFSAWVLVCVSYLYDLINRGFHMEAFLVMVAVATGIKTTDAISKKLNNDNSHQ